MATGKQQLGTLGEELVRRHCICPSCKRGKTIVRLPPNFKCADLICDFCGYLAQVKTKTEADITAIPETVLGAAWAPQEERNKAGIYFPLFLVLITDSQEEYAIYYLPADLQVPEMFEERRPLGPKARRAGWQGFRFRLGPYRSRFVCLYKS